MTDTKPATDDEIARRKSSARLCRCNDCKELLAYISRIKAERARAERAEARVKALEDAIDNFNASIQQECCGQGVGPPDREPECCGQPDLVVDTQAMCALINVRTALKAREAGNG